jgi:hypothetical protein
MAFRDPAGIEIPDVQSMRNRIIASLVIAVFTFAALAVPCAARPAAAYTLVKVSEAPPAELPPALRDAVVGDVLRVNGPGGVLLDIWLCKSVPVVATPSTDLGVTFGQIAEGTLLGAMRIDAATSDYRQQKIKAGLYTLRYALHPVDGDHTGVAPQRDFALLSPVAADSEPATISRQEVLARSTKSTGSKHPSVWSVWPGDDSATAPTLHFQEDSQTWLLNFRIALGSGGQVSMGMIVVGHAPEV